MRGPWRVFVSALGSEPPRRLPRPAARMIQEMFCGAADMLRIVTRRARQGEAEDGSRQLMSIRGPSV